MPARGCCRLQYCVAFYLGQGSLCPFILPISSSLPRIPLQTSSTPHPSFFCTCHFPEPSHLLHLYWLTSCGSSWLLQFPAACSCTNPPRPSSFPPPSLVSCARSPQPSVPLPRASSCTRLPDFTCASPPSALSDQAQPFSCSPLP